MTSKRQPMCGQSSGAVVWTCSWVVGILCFTDTCSNFLSSLTKISPFSITLPASCLVTMRVQINSAGAEEEAPCKSSCYACTDSYQKRALQGTPVLLLFSLLVFLGSSAYTLTTFQDSSHHDSSAVPMFLIHDFLQMFPNPSQEQILSMFPQSFPC